MLNELKKHPFLVGSLAVFVFLSILAYNRLIPSEIKLIPHYDSIGHFVLFGLLGLVAHYSFNRERKNVFGRHIPVGPTLVMSIAFIDEALQVLSINRTFDLMDLFWGLVGISFFIVFARVFRNIRSIDFKYYLKELFSFVMKELRAVIFPGSFLLLLFVSNYIPLGPFHRYDFLFVAAIVIQILMLIFKFETKDEAKTIFLFHIIGLCLELYKTNPAIGSWSYPEDGFLKIAGVPLYSGFMYAAVGSYIAQAWKIFRLRLSNHPSYSLSIVICFLIYLNFFTNHYFYDFRLFLFLVIAIVYYRTDVYFTCRQYEYRMPMLVSFALIGFFVWVAENIATFYGAWKYPGQIHVWTVVSTQKITSWFLLVIICFIVVAWLKHFKEKRGGTVNVKKSV
ncbi:MAG: DUF817 domain-containing protein [Candidatus Paceibacterota bacterium]